MADENLSVAVGPGVGRRRDGVDRGPQLFLVDDEFEAYALGKRDHESGSAIAELLARLAAQILDFHGRYFVHAQLHERVLHVPDSVRFDDCFYLPHTDHLA